MTLFPIRRQRRRRTAVLVLVAIAAILGIVFAVTFAQSESEVRREYLDVAIGVADGERSAAERFADMVIRLDELSRPAVVNLMEEVEAEVVDLSRTLESASAPQGRLERAHTAFAIATQKWKDGIIASRRGIETLSESPLDPDGLASLEQGLIALRVGDAAYGDFLALVLDEDVSDAGREFPPVAYIPSESELLFEATDIARRIFLTPGLGVLRDLAVSDIKLEPRPIGDREGVPVVPLSESLDVEVTVSNRGTVAEAAVLVRIDLVSADGEQATFDRTIAEIEPGSLSSLRFEDLPALPGTLYELVATVTGDDDDPSNNSELLVFIRNDES